MAATEGVCYQLFTADTDLEPDVETALQTLEEQALIKRVGEREWTGPPLEPGDDGTTALREPTVEGRAEARAIREAYSAGVEAPVETYGRDSEVFREELVSLAGTYGSDRCNELPFRPRHDLRSIR